jgi:UDP-GlcNAc:undecaprenyl-phosphate/decaprenyl-phosphate GlcNAc-1-phosphate transferase
MALTEISFESLGLILFTTIFLSMLLVPFTTSFAHKVGAIDVPKNRSSHATPTPRMGGLAMSLSLAIACLAYLPLDGFLVAFLSGLVVIVLTGVIDDVMQVSPLWKFLGQIAAAALFVYLSEMRIEHIGDILYLGNIELGRAAFAFTVFCIVGGVNAFNLADGLDGLAGGVSVIAAVFLCYFAVAAGGGKALIVAVSLIGAVVGFLRFNSYPAKVFMGDSGSLMLGYVVAVLLIAVNHSSSNVSIAALVMVVALPLLDTVLVMARRVRHGHSPFLPDRTHLHHRLLNLGLPHPAVVVVIYCLMFIFGSLAIILRKQTDWAIFSSLLGFGLMIFTVVGGLQRSNFRYGEKGQRRIKSMRQFEIFQKIKNALGKSAKLIGMVILIALFIPALFAPLMGLSGNRALTLFLISGLMAAFSWRTSSANKSILHGTMYLAILTLLLVYEVSTIQVPSWLNTYNPMAAGITLLWVLLKLIFSDHNEIVFASGFELLILFVSWFIPFVVLDELQLSENLVRAVQHACLFSIPFMLAMKINIRNYGGHNRWIAVPLVFGLAAAGARGILIH